MSRTVPQVPADFFERLARPPLSQDPHAVIGALRGGPPARRRGGGFLVLRHADVLAVLRDPAFHKPAMPKVPVRSVQTLFRMFLMLNAPDHTRLRRAVAPLFTPSATERRRAQVHSRACALLDGRHALDVIADYAYPLTFGTIATSLGIAPDLAGPVIAAAAVLTRALDDPMPVGVFDAVRFGRAFVTRRTRPLHTVTAARQMVSFAREHIETRDPVPDDADILAAIRTAREDGTMTADEAIATWVLIVIAGHETTANLIGNATYCLLGHPDQCAAVAADPTLIPGCVEETLRFESPVPAVVRTPTTDVEIDGVSVAKGTLLWLLLGAANRDPAVFSDPDRFDVRRDTSSQLAFSHGSHFCIGASLARLEAEVALQVLLARNPTGQTSLPPRWRDSFSTRGLAHLPVTID